MIPNIKQYFYDRQWLKFLLHTRGDGWLFWKAKDLGEFIERNSTASRRGPRKNVLDHSVHYIGGL